MTLKPILAFSQAILNAAVTPGDIVVDCTMGNGHDTLFLANLVGTQGQVFAFDIQEDALRHTEQRLTRERITQVTLIHANHANLLDHIPPDAHHKIRAAVFNLGYLPGSDKRICTTAHTTIAALDALLSVMPRGSVISAVVYSGHEQGESEAAALLTHCRNIPRETANVIVYQILNNPNRPPFVIALEVQKN